LVLGVVAGEAEPCAAVAAGLPGEPVGVGRGVAEGLVVVDQPVPEQERVEVEIAVSASVGSANAACGQTNVSASMSPIVSIGAHRCTMLRTMSGT
jgi:hypothetical protein